MRMISTPIAAGLLPLVVASASAADLVNTAFLTYSDPTGSAYSGASNTVTVPVSVPIPLPPPDLRAIDGKTFSLEDSLAFKYDATASFVWTFDPQSPASATKTASGSLALGALGQVSAKSAAPKIQLGDHALAVGDYLLTVQVFQTDGTPGPSATAHITLVSANLSNVRVYPNPWKKNVNEGTNITFGNLPEGSTIKIFTVSGHLLREFKAASGQQTWDLRNDLGDKVASGIYVYFVTDNQNHKTRGKIAIVH